MKEFRKHHSGESRYPFMRFIFTLLIIGIFSSQGFSQVFLSLDTFGKKKVMKFYIGDVLTFRLHDDDHFYSLPIQALEPGLIIFPTGEVPIESIDAIKIQKRYIGTKTIAYKLMIFGGSWLGFSVVDAVSEGRYKTSDAFVGGTAIGLGLLIKLLFTKKIFKVSEKRQLKVIDLNIYSTP